jgi:hypothetical protein
VTKATVLKTNHDDLLLSSIFLPARIFLARDAPSFRAKGAIEPATEFYNTCCAFSSTMHGWNNIIRAEGKAKLL